MRTRIKEKLKRVARRFQTPYPSKIENTLNELNLPILKIVSSDNDFISSWKVDLGRYIFVNTKESAEELANRLGFKNHIVDSQEKSIDTLIRNEMQERQLKAIWYHVYESEKVPLGWSYRNDTQIYNTYVIPIAQDFNKEMAM